MLSPFECLCGNFILPEPASYVFFYAFFNLRNLLYLIGIPVTFGSFISTRRKEAKLNLRDTAKHLGISNGYLCDIEQGRRPAPEEAFVERISSFLELDKQEHEILLDLAADSRKTVPADLPDYIRQHDIVRAALRVAKEVDATDEEWKAFMEMLQNRQN